MFISSQLRKHDIWVIHSLNNKLRKGATPTYFNPKTVMLVNWAATEAHSSYNPIEITKKRGRLFTWEILADMIETIKPELPVVFLFYLLDTKASSPCLETHTPVTQKKQRLLKFFKQYRTTLVISYLCLRKTPDPYIFCRN